MSNITKELREALLNGRAPMMRNGECSYDHIRIDAGKSTLTVTMYFHGFPVWRKEVPVFRDGDQINIHGMQGSFPLEIL